MAMGPVHAEAAADLCIKIDGLWQHLSDIICKLWKHCLSPSKILITFRRAIFFLLIGVGIYKAYLRLYLLDFLLKGFCKCMKYGGINLGQYLVLSCLLLAS